MASILVVDDAAFLRMMLKLILIEAGHEVVAEASNGLEAMTIYKQVKPDLVTMDITMPEMDGITAVRGIIDYDPTARIVMCSAVAQKKMIMESFAAGAKDFLVKPFHKDRVTETIAKVMSR
ncbi:response regulator [Paenibacillus marchantiophytorum]|uniref:Response regulator n=1 Tax=Paenibacillus marchantiophytorum TaxID=1619310 RepID=A0ABQ1EQ74_9BACL|nr:response regulator [Paenibacillus marchantiophytorum]GFZ82338.1 response regulator [Paenibacillus marchantiophytorum]